MATGRARFTYSRWDGSQTGFEFDADAAFDELTDDVKVSSLGMKQKNLKHFPSTVLSLMILDAVWST